jgi:hypothetical protein
MTRHLATAFLVVFCSLVGAQHDQPYKGQQAREIKALSEADRDGLREGKGMGLAKAAELNRYPGPMHVLDLKQSLGLSSAQEKKTRAAMAVMRERAKKLGRQIIESEAKLDAEFAGGNARPAEVRRLVRKIGQLQGELRLAHLEAHLGMKGILSKKQVDAYVRLRGYGGKESND